MHVVCALLRFSSCLDAFYMRFELDTHLRSCRGARQRKGLTAAAGAAVVEVVLEETSATATSAEPGGVTVHLPMDASLERQAPAIGTRANHNITVTAIGTIQTSDACCACPGGTRRCT